MCECVDVRARVHETSGDSGGGDGVRRVGGVLPSVFQDVFLFSCCLSLCSLPSLHLLAEGVLCEAAGQQ